MNRSCGALRLAAGTGAVSFAALAVGAAGLGAGAQAAAGDTVTVNNSGSVTVATVGPLSVVASAVPVTCTVPATTRDVVLTLIGPSGSHSASKVIRAVTEPCDSPVTIDVALETPTRNGSYALTLANGATRVTGKATIDVVVPPTAPKGFSITTSGTTAAYRWKANAAPDLKAYQVLSAGSVIKTVQPDSSCQPNRVCATSIRFDKSVQGTARRFGVRAVRCGLTCQDGAGVPGPASTATATFLPAPKPTPTPTPTATPTPTHKPTPARTPSPAASETGSSSGSDDASQGAPSSTPPPVSTSTGSRQTGAVGQPSTVPATTTPPTKTSTAPGASDPPTTPGSPTVPASPLTPPAPSASISASTSASSSGSGVSGSSVVRGVAVALVVLLAGAEGWVWLSHRA